MRNWCAGALFAALAATLPGAAHAQIIGRPDAAHVSLGVGYFDVFQQDETAAEFRGELRTNWRLLGFLDPFIGGSVTTDTSVYGYFGFKTDLYFGDHFVLMPSAAVGAYGRGSGKDLGSVLEFRTGAEFAWRFENRSRLGLGIHHISNASVGDINPGTEIVSINYSIPLDLLR
jgi:lipid A 3-O-deacylase